MTSFDAQLRMAGEMASPIAVFVDLSADRIRLTAGGKHLANWRLDEITIMPTANGYRITAEGEEVILNITNRAEFATEIGRRNQTR